MNRDRVALLIMILGLLAMALLIWAATAHAHSFYDLECCQDKDCRPVACSEVRRVGPGWVWKDRSFTPAMLRFSPDGNCHVCVGVAPHCIYLPQGS